MRSFHKALAVAVVTACAAAITPAMAGDDLNPNAFVKMCDADKDGMVSKAEFMKAVEKMYDKQDTKKMGKLDKKQTEALLKELMKGGGA
jgi:hypothetical protein